jgi:hypothetical protein
LIHVHPSQSATQIFLNCTKNTELTARPFAPTFTLALSTKLKLGQDSNRPGTQLICHPEQALLAQRRIWASRAKCRVLCDTLIARLARFLINIHNENWTKALMKAPNPWITYRTRFLVKAKQLTTSLAFTDVLGRQHSGRKGDYLVESSDGVLRIAPRQIFEDIYVPLVPLQADEDEASDRPSTPQQSEILRPDRTSPQSEPLPHRESLRKRATPALSLPLHLTCKSPQPYRDGRTPASSLRSL